MPPSPRYPATHAALCGAHTMHAAPPPETPPHMQPLQMPCHARCPPPGGHSPSKLLPPCFCWGLAACAHHWGRMDAGRGGKEAGGWAASNQLHPAASRHCRALHLPGLRREPPATRKQREWRQPPLGPYLCDQPGAWRTALAPTGECSGEPGSPLHPGWALPLGKGQARYARVNVAQGAVATPHPKPPGTAPWGPPPCHPTLPSA